MLGSISKLIILITLSIAAAYVITSLNDCFALAGFTGASSCVLVFLFTVICVDGNGDEIKGEGMVKNPFNMQEMLNFTAYISVTFALAFIGLAVITNYSIDAGVYNNLLKISIMLLASILSYIFLAIHFRIHHVEDREVEFEEHTLHAARCVIAFFLPMFLVSLVPDMKNNVLELLIKGGVVLLYYLVIQIYFKTKLVMAEKAKKDKAKDIMQKMENLSSQAQGKLKQRHNIKNQDQSNNNLLTSHSNNSNFTSKTTATHLSTVPMSPSSSLKRLVRENMESNTEANKKNDDDDDDTTASSFNEKLRIFFDSSRGGIVFDMLQLLVSLCACCHYIWWTTIAYNENYIGYTGQDGCIVENNYVLWFSLHHFFVFMFVLDYSIHLLTRKSVSVFFYDVTSLADLISILPIAASFFRLLLQTLDNMTDQEAPRLFEAFFFLRFLRLYKYAPRIIMFHYDWSVQHIVTEAWKTVGSNILYMTFQILALVFCTAGIIFAVEYNPVSPNRNLSSLFHCLYFTVVTLGTVGYGDYHVTNDTGRLTFIFVIFCGIAVIPFQASRLVASLRIAREKATWQTPYIEMPGFSHVVICGMVSSATLFGLVDELLHEDHDVVLKVVLIGPDNPSEEVQNALLAGRFSTRVNYIRSPVVTWEALKLASMETAIACVIYNSAGNSDRERDSTSIYNIITVKKYRSHNQTHGIPTLIIAETVVPTNKHRLETAGADIVLCFQSMKCRLLGRSLLSPGLSTIVCNLIASGADEGAEAEVAEEELRFNYQQQILKTNERTVMNKSLADILTKNSSTGILQSDGEIAWLEEYTHGMKYEIYRVKLNRSFINLNFAVASKKVYEKFGMTMFAVLQKRDPLMNTSNFLRTHLFPGSRYLINDGDFAFVIAMDAKDCKELMSDNFDIMSERKADKEKIDIIQSPSNANENNSGMNSQVSRGLEVSESINESESASESMSACVKDANSKSQKSVNSTRENREERKNKLAEERRKKEKESKNVSEKKEKKEKEIPLEKQNTMGKRKTTFLNVFKKNPSRRDMVESESTPTPISVNKCRMDSIDDEDVDEIEYNEEEAMEYVRTIKNHLVLCMENFADAHMTAMLSIIENDESAENGVVILTSNIKKDVKYELQKLPGVYTIIATDSFSKKDLMAANMKACKRVLILSSRSIDDSFISFSDADRVTTFMYLTIRDYVSEETVILLEMLGSGNLRYIDPTTWWPTIMTRRTQYFAPTYAAGYSLVPMSLELMIAQAIFNPTNIECLLILMSATEAEQTEQRAGLAFVGYDNISSNVYIMNVPVHFNSRPYGELFSVLVEDYDILPMGLYCGVNSGKGNALPFVYTNPTSTTKLNSVDKVYVLASGQEQTLNAEKAMPKNDKQVLSGIKVRSSKTSVRRLSSKLTSKISKKDSLFNVTSEIAKNKSGSKVYPIDDRHSNKIGNIIGELNNLSENEKKEKDSGKSSDEATEMKKEEGEEKEKKKESDSESDSDDENAELDHEYTEDDEDTNASRLRAYGDRVRRLSISETKALGELIEDVESESKKKVKKV